MAEDLPPEWEAVKDDEGRTYWWNTVTNDTTWKKPTLVVAKKEVAAGYLSSVRAEDASARTQKATSRNPEIEAIRGRSSVENLTAKFARSSSISNSSSCIEEPKPSTPAQVDRTNASAKSVSALKKLQEAKEYLAKSEEEKIGPSPASGRGSLSNSGGKPLARRDKDFPPKIDIFK